MIQRKYVYTVDIKTYVKNPTLNLLVHTLLQIIRGMAGIIDGIVLILSFGRLFTGLGFKAVVWINKKQK